MKVQDFVSILGADFFTGVPDSQLKALCNHLMRTYGVDPKHHLIAANEGNAAALAAGYHLATGKIPVVYMQNSGEGNIINPVASLLSPDVYGIPMIFVIGWRGEPGVKDEPQHVYQGKVTLRLMEDMDIPCAVVSQDTTREALEGTMSDFQKVLQEGRDVAFVIRKGALTEDEAASYGNPYTLLREDAIREIADFTGDDPIVSTTGKASRELFEIREARGEDHGRDFLTVGSMGHASSIALGIALQRPEARVWCIDGDGAALMHMGAMGVIGATGPSNLIHIVLDNQAHETVGGMPTVSGKIRLDEIAKACGYRKVVQAQSKGEIREALTALRETEGPAFLQVHCALGARADLGRPTTSPRENKEAFMRHLETL